MTDLEKAEIAIKYTIITGVSFGIVVIDETKASITDKECVFLAKHYPFSYQEIRQSFKNRQEND